MNRTEAALSEAADALQAALDRDRTLLQDIGVLIAAGKRPNMFRILRWPDGSDPVTLMLQLEPTPK